MPFLTYLDPASIDPKDLVNRVREVDWLRASLDSFLKAGDKSRGRAVAILGERGIGKSIVMQKVLDGLKQLHAATTLMVVVDCRGVGSQRGVYYEIARQVVDQLGFRDDPPMLDTARVLETIAAQDEVERKVLAERVTAFKGAVKLSGSRALLGLLGLSYGIDLEYSKRTRLALEGTINFDSTRLRQAIVALFRDLREHAQLDVIVALDNLDELRHEALTDEDLRTWLSSEIDGLLGLVRAPIGFVVTARTYFAGSLNRQIDNTRVLPRLADDEHADIIRTRLTHESGEVQRLFHSEEHSGLLDCLANIAPTPLALLSWFKFLAENELYDKEPHGALRQLLADRYANFQPEILEAVVRAFNGKPKGPVSAKQLLDVCNQRHVLFNQLLRSQVVLPVDFWSPYEFTLAPELHFMCN